jgi:hypothetical protein
MIYINKISSAEPIDFAASELKKYLRMMMPEGPDVKISYDPSAKNGFRLGLMSDFGLKLFETEDAYLDDVIFIDCDENGGMIAGSNPRAVLLAVYEYLRQNGCRWLYPGTDGEFIPEKNIAPVKLRFTPSMRCRGFAAEGSVYQDSVLNMLDFLPKVGMNTLMIEFRLPRSYYAIYYMHTRPIKFLQDFFKCDPQYIKWWIFFWVEAALLAFLFCFNLFLHAKRGILLGVPKWNGKKFPWKRYLLISSITSLVVSICMCLRWITRYNSPEINNAGLALIYAYIVLSIFIVLFFTLFVSFVIAYIIAKKTKKSVE